MEFIAELLMEFLMGIFVEIPMESENVKTWVKTVIFLLPCTLVLALIGFLFYQAYFVWKDAFAYWVSGGLFAFFLGLAVYGAIDGHKRGWKQK